MPLHPLWECRRSMPIHAICATSATHSIQNATRFMVSHTDLASRRSPGPQHFADRPSLRDAPTRREGCIPVVNFTERSEAVAGDLFAYRVEKTFCRVAVSVDADVGKDKRPDEPAPNRTLVIDAIALPRAAPVVSLIARFPLRQTAQSVRCCQAPRANIHNGFLLVRGKRTFRQRHRKNLIRTQ